MWLLEDVSYCSFILDLHLMGNWKGSSKTPKKSPLVPRRESGKTEKRTTSGNPGEKPTPKPWTDWHDQSWEAD